MAEGEAIAPGELGRFGLRPCELVDHLAFGDSDLTDIDREIELGWLQFDRHGPDPQLTNKGMRVAVAALCRIAERQQETFIPARQGLQSHGAIGGKGKGLSRQVARLTVALRLWPHKALGRQDSCDPWCGLFRRLAAGAGRR